ncbi:PREDICTED: kelch repeat and BTB domain-containing protein 8-like [Drosophila arizonae]|uniref:Kelch repeat and BTB domain-containing protein 8-like n=1 Tax=Drosophila arizonae TaxID=7263 RepID=A0ABM1PHU9_DROAR|nr:PREDICTED: kelch repeat and BTB domain-containing protein 8-like [Drosophila arizonae]
MDKLKMKNAILEQRNLMTKDINPSVLMNILECCKESPLADVEYAPFSVSDRKTLLDDSFKCHLICNQAKLKAGLANIVQNRIRTDVQVVVHGTTFDCHLTVLQVASEYFRLFTSTHTIVIDEPEVTVLAFEKLYEWILKGKAFRLRVDWLLDMYRTARFLKMPKFIDRLWGYFENTKNFSEGHAFNLYIKAIPYPTEMLQALMLTRVNRFFLTAVTTTEYLNLTAEQVYAMLTTSVLAVNSEMEVLMSALRWMMYDWEERKKHKLFLMQAVRFNLMPAWYILSLKTKQKMPELAEILEEPVIQDTLDAGLSYSVTQHFVHSDSPLQKPLELNTEHQREWIIDRCASHHHLYNCPNWTYLDYNVFNIYMMQIIKAKNLHFDTLRLFKPSNFAPCCQETIKNCKTLLEI